MRPIIPLVLTAVALSSTAFCVSNAPNRQPIKQLRRGARWGVETTIEHGWYPGHSGVVANLLSRFRSKPYRHQCVMHSDIERGSGTFIRVYRSSYVVGSLDGYSWLEATFQIAGSLEVGETYRFRPVSLDRAPIQQDDSCLEYRMRPGEFTAGQYGNPYGGWMRTASDSTASITVVRKHWDTMDVVVRIKADIRFGPDIDSEEEFRLRYKPVAAR